MKYKLPYRQIHLDFHTSELVEDIGLDFDGEKFAKTLLDAHVNSITCFARCHHGMIYYDTKINKERVHPNLKEKRLLEKQIEACHKHGIKVPVYTTVQWDHYTAKKHPEWLVRKPDGSIEGDYFNKAGFYQRICVNTPYIDFLNAHVKEMVEYLDLDGVFLDIVSEMDCSCTYCMESMLEKNMDPLVEEDRRKHYVQVMNDFKKNMSSLIWSIKPDILVFFNSGHVSYKDKLPSRDTYSHYEIESLPSGGWGYKHFPVTCRYVRNLGKDFLAHTGKFHTSWGDFHSFKNVEALEYEVFRMLALNSKCLIGDQLNPDAKLCENVYDLVGKVYSQVEAKEPWCQNAKALAEIGVFIPTDEKVRVSSSQSAIESLLDQLAYQFDFIDKEMDFGKYKLLIIPERISIDEKMKDKLNTYLSKGGKVISVFDSIFDGLSVKVVKETKDDYGNPVKGVFAPHNDFADYLIPTELIGKNLYKTEYVMYAKGVEVVAIDGGKALVKAYDPVFNRSYKHFSSHLHGPSSKKESYDGVVLNKDKNAIYFAHPIFEIYNKKGTKWIKEFLADAINYLLPDKLVSHDGPSTVFCALNEQVELNRMVLHLLHYIPERRSTDFDTIEDVIPLYSLNFVLNHDPSLKIKSVKLVPENIDVKFEVKKEGQISFTLDKLHGHSLLSIEYEK